MLRHELMICTTPADVINITELRQFISVFHLVQFKIIMDAKRNIIKAFIENGYDQATICREVRKLNINKMLVYRTYIRYVETGNVKIKKKTGRPRTVKTPKLIKKVRESLQRNCARSCRKLAKTYRVSRQVMQRILKDDLRMTAYKKIKIHEITDAQRKKQYERTREL
ncbi:hypothetical protein ILUMI_20551 [Ignelater luminosus]|uniref:Uncharacterized protein n=1 Tax=Ignelater luminosus TaxID=2038154 RepID=A0A8K0CE25_IGNLU|nr:hypothetical protein ILUMI_20551 [Ignelater luminosus]